MTAHDRRVDEIIDSLEKMHNSTAHYEAVFTARRLTPNAWEKAVRQHELNKVTDHMEVMADDLRSL